MKQHIKLGWNSHGERVEENLEEVDQALALIKSILSMYEIPK